MILPSSQLPDIYWEGQVVRCISPVLEPVGLSVHNQLCTVIHRRCWTWTQGNAGDDFEYMYTVYFPHLGMVAAAAQEELRPIADDEELHDERRQVESSS